MAENTAEKGGLIHQATVALGNRPASERSRTIPIESIRQQETDVDKSCSCFLYLRESDALCVLRAFDVKAPCPDP